MQRDPAAQPLAGEVVVFTGKLSSIGRKDARALVERDGGIAAEEVNARTTLLVIGEAGFAGGAPSSAKVRRVEELNAQGLSIRVVTEEAFCRLLGEPTPAERTRQLYGSRDLLARYDALREDHLRYLVKYGIIKPALRTPADTFFAFQDLAVIKQAHDEISQGVSFRSAVRGLRSSRQGQLTLDFSLEADPAKIVTLQPRAAKTLPIETPPPPRDTARAEEYFRDGSDLDDGTEANLTPAAAFYRKALECDPQLVAALINLANIHYTRHETIEAQALYERAIALESDYFEAHFNLGNIHHDLGEYESARTCYETALDLNPNYPDTHFYLAVTLEKMGLSAEARPHWRSYRTLSPQGEWVELAREFSE